MRNHPPSALKSHALHVHPSAFENLSPNIAVGEPHLNCMIRKLKSGEFRLYSRKKDARSGKRKNLGTFSSLAAAKKHERAVQYFKRAG
jgi:hypothetical protein